MRRGIVGNKNTSTNVADDSSSLRRMVGFSSRGDGPVATTNSPTPILSEYEQRYQQRHQKHQQQHLQSSEDDAMALLDLAKAATTARPPTGRSLPSTLQSTRIMPALVNRVSDMNTNDRTKSRSEAMMSKTASNAITVETESTKKQTTNKSSSDDVIKTSAARVDGNISNLSNKVLLSKSTSDRSKAIGDARMNVQVQHDTGPFCTNRQSIEQSSSVNLRKHVSLNSHILRHKTRDDDKPKSCFQSTSSSQGRAYRAPSSLPSKSARTNVNVRRYHSQPVSSKEAKQTLVSLSDSLFLDSYLQKQNLIGGSFKYPLDFSLGLAVRHHVLLPCLAISDSSNDRAAESLYIDSIKSLFSGKVFVKEIRERQVQKVSAKETYTDIQSRSVPATIQVCNSNDSFTLANWYKFKGDKFLRYSSQEWSDFWEQKANVPDVDCEMIKLVTNSPKSEVLGFAYIERSIVDQNVPGGTRITLLRGLRVSPTSNIDAKRRSFLAPPNERSLLPKYRDVAETLLMAVIIRSFMYGTTAIGVNSVKDDHVENFYSTYMGPALCFSNDGRKYFRMHGMARWNIIRKHFLNQVKCKLEFSAASEYDQMEKKSLLIGSDEIQKRRRLE